MHLFSSRVNCCDMLTCVLVRMCWCVQCASVMRECLLVLAPVVFNPSPEARISSSLSHRPLLSLAEHLAMQALINTGMAILSVTEGGRGGTVSLFGRLEVGDWCQHEMRGGGRKGLGREIRGEGEAKVGKVMVRRKKGGQSERRGESGKM